MKAGCLLTSVWFPRWSVNSGTLAAINDRLPVLRFHVASSGNTTPLIIKQRLPSKGSEAAGKASRLLGQGRTQQHSTRLFGKGEISTATTAAIIAFYTQCCTVRPGQD